jgi:ubiquinone biosynthesis protein
VSERALESLLAEQRHTNGLLRLIIAGASGVLLGLAVAVLFTHWH